MSWLLYVTIFLCCGLASAQSERDRRKAELDAKGISFCRSEMTSSETAEHKYARGQCEDGVVLYLKRVVAMAAAKSLCEKYHYSDDVYQLYLKAIHQVDDAASAVYVLREKMQHADSCKAVFDSTIKLQLSALSVEQDEWIKACKAAEQYPPKIQDK